LGLIKRVLRDIGNNFAELYTLFVMVVAIPTVVGFMTEFIFGVFLSLLLQALIGVLYVKGKTNSGVVKK
jgi:hypothetical protein